MKRCVLKSEFEKGYRIFWYNHLESTDKNSNKDYVKVYTDENNEDFLMICHISKIITVPDDEILEKQMGHIYPSIKFVRSHQEEYESQQ